jgi:hypothetical protein
VMEVPPDRVEIVMARRMSLIYLMNRLLSSE